MIFGHWESSNLLDQRSRNGLMTAEVKSTYMQQTCHFRGVATGSLLVLEPEGHFAQILQQAEDTMRSSLSVVRSEMSALWRALLSLLNWNRSHLAFFKDPLLRPLGAKFLDVLEHVKDDVLNVHCRERSRLSPCSQTSTHKHTWSLMHFMKNVSLISPRVHPESPGDLSHKTLRTHHLRMIHSEEC